MLVRGALGLRTCMLPPMLNEVLVKISEEVDDDTWLVIVNSMWSMWRCQNDAAYGGKSPTFEQFLKYHSQINMESFIRAIRKTKPIAS